MNYLGKIIFSLGLALSSLFGYHQPQSFGNYNPTGGGTYRLQSSLSSSATSITLTSFKEPSSNIAYTMSYLNSAIEYGTIEPQSTNKEFISFTGITQNADGTATLTGVVRGLGFSYPYTASSTLQESHSGQSIFILSNPPQYSNQFYTLANVSTSTNTLIFSSTTPPMYDSVAAQAAGTFISSTSELASIAYVNATGAGVNVNATEGIKGISLLATQLQMASSTFSASSPTVLYTKYSTSTPYHTCALCIPITQNDGTISNLFTATSSLYNYVWGGIHTFTGGINASSTNNFIASSTQYIENVGTINATSTIKVNGVTLGVVQTLSTGYQGTIAAASTTFLTIAIPANTLTISNSLSGLARFADSQAAGAGDFCNVDIGTGNATTSIASAIVGGPAIARFNVFATSTSAISVSSEFFTGGQEGTKTAPGNNLVGFWSLAYPPNAILYIAFTGNTDGSGGCQLVGRTVQVIN